MSRSEEFVSGGASFDLTPEHDQFIERARDRSEERSLHGRPDCYHVSTALSRKFGWPQESGYYGSGRRSTGHYWNRLPDGRILDATHDQFDEDTPVRIAPADHPKYRKAD